MANTILITEDYKFQLKVLTRYFTGLGFTVFSAETSRDTIRLAAQHLPDCFLLDYNLGDETIVPACLFIRSHERLKNAPILILSGEHEKAEECYNNYDADLFLEKNKPLTEVGAAVRRQLRRAEVAIRAPQVSDISLDYDRLCLRRATYPEIQLSPEQFKFFALLFKKSPQFVPEAEVCAVVMNDAEGLKRDAVNMLAHRLRQRLGPQLGKRIKNIKRLGWTYVQPRVRVVQ